MEKKAEKSMWEREGLRLERPRLALQMEGSHKQPRTGSSQKLDKVENRVSS